VNTRSNARQMASRNFTEDSFAAYDILDGSPEGAVVKRNLLR